MLNEHALEAADAIINAFERPNYLPKPLATMFLRTSGDIPCRKWSWRNRFLVALHGHTDARGFRQWQAVGRTVKKGEKAFHILTPCTKQMEDEGTGEKRKMLMGFRGAPVFGHAQTDGEPLPPADAEADRWIASLPFVEVAKAWGLRVEAYDGEDHGALGWFRKGECIALGCKNLTVWAHELVHAADRRLHNPNRDTTLPNPGSVDLLNKAGKLQPGS